MCLEANVYCSEQTQLLMRYALTACNKVGFTMGSATRQTWEKTHYLVDVIGVGSTALQKDRGNPHVDKSTVSSKGKITALSQGKCMMNIILWNCAIDWL